jgi:RNA polymerase sigma-70 factor (ECF subfamily)
VLKDEQLVERASEGNDAAFAELVDRYQERLLRFLQTRGLCRADAEDALQDTFINAYRYLPSFNPRWRFSTWIYRIALRNAARHAEAARAPLADDAELPTDPLAACVVAGERENLWLTAKKLLSDDAYAAMWLRYVEDLPLAEVARALERSVPWTKVTLMRSRRRLRAACADDAIGKKESEAFG